LDHPEWAADPRFATNRARVEHRGELVSMLNGVFLDRGTAAWQTLLTAVEVPHAPVLALDEILATPQVAARRMVRELTAADGRTYRVVASPIHSGGEPFCSPRPPPAIGEHSEEVFREWLGYAADRIARLRNQKVIE
jgi:crotonobetainyl-CoA:carnitine CoA-transferase CaiB-like acyl-CoA transferase